MGRRTVIVMAVAAGLLAAQSRPMAESKPVAESQPAGDPDAYAPLFKFCPEKVESVMLVSAAGLPEELKDLITVSGDFQREAKFKAVRAVHAGRKHTDQGDSESVRVYELEKPILLADVLIEDRFSYETIAGTPCFVHKKDDDMGWGPVEDWVTVIDRKYMVFATRRALLKDALAKRGPTPEACVERTGWKSADVNWGSPILIVRKTEPEKAKTTPFERLLFTYEAGKKKGRLDVVGKDGQAVLKHFRESLGDKRAESRATEEEEEHRWPGFATVDLGSSSGDRHVLAVTLANSEYTWAWNHLVQVIRGGYGYF